MSLPDQLPDSVMSTTQPTFGAAPITGAAEPPNQQHRTHITGAFHWTQRQASTLNSNLIIVCALDPEVVDVIGGQSSRSSQYG